ncbi:DMT family transporter [Salinisphaera sp. T31B1]|uniref:DMT family transporter n=1 Tax=Salinisphaera sp. T31B1 TaxID=727963 RepID=UPI0033424820
MREAALLIVVVMLFAGNILVGKATADALAPFTLALARSMIACLAASLCFGAAAWRHRALFYARGVRLFVIGASGIGLFNALLYAALHTTDTTSVAVMEAMIPVATASVMWLFAGERLGRRAWLGVLVSAVGASVVVARGAPWTILADMAVGDGLMLAAIGAWIVYAQLARRGLAGLPIFSTMVPLTASAVICLLPLALIEHAVLGMPWHGSNDALAGAAYLGLGPSFVAFIIYNRAVVSVGPTVAAISLNGLPVVVMIGSWAWLGTSIGAAQLAGTAAVAVGVSMLLAFRGPTNP